MISLWVVVLVVWSCFISFKEPTVNEYIKGEERGSINADAAEPLLVEDEVQK